MNKIVRFFTILSLVVSMTVFGAKPKKKFYRSMMGSMTQESKDVLIGSACAEFNRALDSGSEFGVGDKDEGISWQLQKDKSHLPDKIEKASLTNTVLEFDDVAQLLKGSWLSRGQKIKFKIDSETIWTVDYDGPSSVRPSDSRYKSRKIKLYRSYGLFRYQCKDIDYKEIGQDPIRAHLNAPRVYTKFGFFTKSMMKLAVCAAAGMAYLLATE